MNSDHSAISAKIKEWTGTQENDKRKTNYRKCDWVGLRENREEEETEHSRRIPGDAVRGDKTTPEEARGRTELTPSRAAEPKEGDTKDSKTRGKAQRIPHTKALVQ